MAERYSTRVRAFMWLTTLLAVPLLVLTGGRRSSSVTSPCSVGSASSSSCSPSSSWPARCGPSRCRGARSPATRSPSRAPSASRSCSSLRSSSRSSRRRSPSSSTGASAAAPGRRCCSTSRSTRSPSPARGRSTRWPRTSRSHRPSGPSPHLLAAVLAGAAFLVINNGLVGMAVALRLRVRLWGVVGDDLTWQLMTSAPLLGLGPLAAQAAMWTPASIVLLLIPIVALHRSGVTAMQREQESLRDPLTGLANRTLLANAAERALEQRRHDRHAAHRPRPLQGRQRHARARRRRRAAARRRRPAARGGRPGRPGRPPGRRRVRRPGPPVRRRRRGRRAGQPHRRGDPPAVPGAGRRAHRRLLGRHRPGPRPRATRSRACCGAPTSRCTAPRRPAGRTRSTTGRPTSTRRRCSACRPTSGPRSRTRTTTRSTSSTSPSSTCAPAARAPSSASCAGGTRCSASCTPTASSRWPRAPRSSTCSCGACSTWRCRRWRAGTTRGSRSRVAVNLSARQLSDLTLPDTVADVLVRHGLPPGRLQLEVTESRLMSDPERSTAILRAPAGARRLAVDRRLRHGLLVAGLPPAPVASTS